MNKFNTTEKSAQNDLEFRVETLEQIRLGQQSTLDYITITQAVNLDSLELQAATNTVNLANKVSKTDHTANKVFISSATGVFETSSIASSELSKLPNITVSAPVNLNQNQTDIDASKAITDLISITQAVDLDNIESQQTIIVGNLGTVQTNQVLLFTHFNLITVTQAVNLDTMESDITANNAKTGISGAEQTKLGHISVSQGVDLDVIESNLSTNISATGINTSARISNTSLISTNISNISNNSSSISTNSSSISTNSSDIADIITDLGTRRAEIYTNENAIATNTYDLTGINYSIISTAGDYEIKGGDWGGLSSFYSNGSIEINGGYDGINTSGEVKIKQNNLVRLKISNSDTSIGLGNNKLIVDSAYVSTSTPGMEFNSSAYFLLKKPSLTTHWNMIMDRGDAIWSGFRSAYHWDCYNDNVNKYDMNATGATMYLNYYSHGNVNICGQGGNVRMGGFLGIGGDALYGLHVRHSGDYASTHAHYGIYQSPGSFMDSGAFNRVGIGITNGYYTNTYLAAKIDYGLWVSTLTTSSDRRIKTNIREVPDDLSLKQLRDLPCVYYDYIDYQKKGSASTIGFIAQDVREIMPMAVSLKKEFIPNEMRNLDNFSWETIKDLSGNEKFKLTINDLDVSGNTKFRFYVNNGDNEKNLEIENLENEPKSFIFEEKWKNIFLYGKEVDDFHIIEKDKIFAMLFSATQEIDKIQQEHIIEIKTLKEKITTLEDKITNILSRLDASGI